MECVITGVSSKYPYDGIPAEFSSFFSISPEVCYGILLNSAKFHRIPYYSRILSTIILFQAEFLVWVEFPNPEKFCILTKFCFQAKFHILADFHILATICFPGKLCIQLRNSVFSCNSIFWWNSLS